MARKQKVEISSEEEEEYISDITSSEEEDNENEEITPEQNEEDDDEEVLEMMAFMNVMKEKKGEKREFIDNHEALIRLEKEMNLDHLPWVELQTVTSSKPIQLKDVNDDLNRELAFYQQALEATEIGLEKLRKEGVPTTRPNDYFAEMVKSDQHMERIRRKLLDEHMKITKSEQARRQRELKKFGKKVQQEKLLERQKQKKMELERIKLMKDKNEDFDITVEKPSNKLPEKSLKRKRKASIRECQ
jgi:rRNA-processing protein EBP2